MLGDMYNASDVTKMRTVRAESGAVRDWRFRNFKTKGQVAVTAVITSVLGLFLR